MLSLVAGRIFLARQVSTAASTNEATEATASTHLPAAKEQFFLVPGASCATCATCASEAWAEPRGAAAAPPPPGGAAPTQQWQEAGWKRELRGILGNPCGKSAQAMDSLQREYAEVLRESLVDEMRRVPLCHTHAGVEKHRL